MQLAGEKVTGGGEVGNRLRRARLPASAYDLYIFPRSQTGNPLDAEQTYPRPVGAFDLAGIIAHAAPSSYRHLHIGLPRADPHLADQHVLQRNGLPVRNGNRIRSSRVGSFQLQHPFSVRSATGSDGRSVPRPVAATSAPGSAQPQRGASHCRCKTMSLPKTEASRTLACSKPPAISPKQRIPIFFRFISDRFYRPP